MSVFDVLKERGFIKQLSHEEEIKELLEKEKIIRESVKTIVDPWKELTTDEKLQKIVEFFSEVEVDSEAMIVVAETLDTQPKTETYSALSAPLNKKASQSGIALAVKAMCDELNIKNDIVMGTKDKIPHLWLIIKRGEVWQHFDVTTEGESYIISDRKSVV